MLATSSIGAIWSSCSPDFGVQGVLDRFGQIEPKVLLAVDGYWYNGKPVDTLDKVREIAAKLPSVDRVVVVPYLSAAPDVSGVAKGATLAAFTADHAPRDIAFARMPFNHPLYILYSSGTTGVPEVHRARRRRHAAAAPEGAPAAFGREAGRPGVLLHHLRLDDVELAGVRPGRGRHAAALRRFAVRRPRQHPVRLRRRRAHDAFRHVGQVHRRHRQDRPQADARRTSSPTCARCFPPARRWCRRASTTCTAT